MIHPGAHIPLSERDPVMRSAHWLLPLFPGPVPGLQIVYTEIDLSSQIQQAPIHLSVPPFTMTHVSLRVALCMHFQICYGIVDCWYQS